MKDFHSHILFGIDDGSQDINTSIEILKKLEQEGVTELILTPHYIENTKYNASNEEKNKRYQQLIKEATANNINIKIYLGNEVYITPNIRQLINDNQITTINNTKYILIELPLTTKIHGVADIIFELISYDYIPIIAHPERYTWATIEYFKKLNEFGALFQGNYRSLFNYYGKKANKKLKTMLKENLISFLGTDVHKLEETYNISKLGKKILKITKNKEKTKELLESNFDKVVNNEKIK